MKSLYNKKIRTISWGIIFLMLINIIPQKIIWGAETDTNASINNTSIEVATIQESFANQVVGSYVYGDLTNNGAKVTDIWQKGSWSFTIYGSDFTDNIKEVHLKRIEGANPITITIDKSDLTVVNKDELIVYIKGNNAINFSKEKYTGNYYIELEYNDGSIYTLQNEYKGKEITVTGHNFKSDIKQVVLKNIKNGAWGIILPKEKVKYINTSTLKLTLEASDIEKIYKGFDSADIEMVIQYESNCIFDDDLYYWKMPLNGDNFKKGIEKIILRPISGQALSLPSEEQDIIIEKQDISVDSDTRLNIYFKDDVLDKLREYNHSGNYKMIVVYSSETNLKELTVPTDLLVLYNYGLQTRETVTINEGLKFDNKDYIEDYSKFTLLSKSTPKVIGIFPKSVEEYPWVNEDDLSHDILEDRSFLKITFEDIDGKLEFNSPLGINNLLSSSVIAVGSNTDYLDKEFLNMCLEDTNYIGQYLFKKDRTNKRAYLYIPVKQLSPQGNYSVNILGKVLRNDASDNGTIDENKRYSEPISWEFTTMASPSVSEKGVLNQTVIEGYDNDTYIKIFGDFFYDSSVEVFFNDEEADYVTVKSDNDRNVYLQVYLPNRRRRLEPGIYNITVENDRDHTTTVYGSLSVLPKGDSSDIPKEEYKVKDENAKGDILSEISVSKDTLYLNNRYRDNAIVELDLDELMGEEVWSRNINYRGYRGDYIGELTAKSKYVDISFYNLTLDRAADGSEINLKVGRADPIVIQGIKKKVGDKIVKSNFIEIKEENCTWDKIYISIPYQNSDGNHLALYRYDEIRRTWNKEDSYVDKVNKTVNGISNKTGIYVVLEN